MTEKRPFQLSDPTRGADEASPAAGEEPVPGTATVVDFWAARRHRTGEQPPRPEPEPDPEPEPEPEPGPTPEPAPPSPADIINQALADVPKRATDLIAGVDDPPPAAEGPGDAPRDILARALDALTEAWPVPPLDEAPSPATEAAPPAEANDFWQVWLQHQAHLRRQTLRLMAGNPYDAEDALSNAMLKASQKFADYRGAIVNERAWLTRLVHNVCMDFYRAHKRQARWVEESPFDEPAAPAPPAAEAEPTPEEELLGRQSIAALRRELARMPEKLREPFVMRFLQEMSYDEIADRLGLSNCAVRKRIQLARQQLRDSGIR